MLLNTHIPFSYILKKVRYDLIYVFVTCILVLFVTHRYRDVIPVIPLTIPAFLGTAISILLSFKLSQSYDRWWEARKVWGAIVNDSRTFVIQLKTLTATGNKAFVEKIGYRQIAWCFSLGQSLRGLNPTENLEKFITSDEMEEIETHSNKPLALLHLHGLGITELKEKGQLDIYGQVQLNETIARLCDSQGKAERIKTTVFPVTYSIFLHSLIYLFVVTLSIALIEMNDYFEIPIIILISTSFLLLEKSATHMQDPFENRPSDTAVTAIARTIEINIKELFKESEIPAPHLPERFYLL